MAVPELLLPPPRGVRQAPTRARWSGEPHLILDLFPDKRFLTMQPHREAKGLALELRALVKRKEPWDRDLEFQRESSVSGLSPSPDCESFILIPSAPLLQPAQCLSARHLLAGPRSAHGRPFRRRRVP